MSHNISGRSFGFHIITQNIDNLHKQARSSNVPLLHGELMKTRSTGDESLIYDIDPLHCDIRLRDFCDERGFQLHTTYDIHHIQKGASEEVKE